MARVGVCEAGHVAGRFAIDRTGAYRRLAVLVEAGLLQHERYLHARPGVYFATRAGLAATGVALPPARLGPATYEHQVAVASLAIALEREFAPDRVVTEREMRSRDTGRERPEFALRLPGASRGGYPRLHFSDLAVLDVDERGRPLAVELERTLKGRARLRRIVRAYVAARHIAGARYYVSGAAERAVGAAVEEAQAGALVSLWSAAESGAASLSPSRASMPIASSRNHPRGS